MIIFFCNNTTLKPFMEEDHYNEEEVREQFICAADLFSEANVVFMNYWDAYYWVSMVLIIKELKTVPAILAQLVSRLCQKKE